MALHFFDGFETVGTETGIGDEATTGARVALIYNKANNGSGSTSTHMFLIDSRNADGYAWNYGTNENNFIQAEFPGGAEFSKTWVVGFYVHTSDTATASQRLMAAIEDLAPSADHFALWVDSDGQLEAFDASGLTSLGSGAAGDMSMGTWQHVEVKFTVNGTTGSILVNVDGDEKLNLTNVNTQDFTGNVRGILFGGYGATGTKPAGTGTDLAAIDDIWIGNTDSPAPNDFLGTRVIVKSLPPNGDNVAQWDTTSSGTVHYTLVDENGADAADYVETTTNADRDEFDLDDISDSGATVHAIKIEALADDQSSGSGNTLDVEVESGGSRSQSSFTVSSATAAVFTHYDETDPQGGGAWTPARVDAMRAGIEFNT